MKRIKTKIVTHTRAHITDPLPATMTELARQWRCSPNKARRLAEPFRGQLGFMETGTHEDVRKHRRKYSIVTISHALQTKIEASMRAHRTSHRS
jgi:hypothetical protein